MAKVNYYSMKYCTVCAGDLEHYRKKFFPFFEIRGKQCKRCGRVFLEPEDPVIGSDGIPALGKMIEVKDALMVYDPRTKKPLDMIGSKSVAAGGEPPTIYVEEQRCGSRQGGGGGLSGAGLW